MSSHPDTIALPIRQGPALGLTRRRLAALALVALLGALAVVAVPYLPTSLGGQMSYVIVAGQSMQPTLDHGDFVAVERRSSYRAGDVVAYRVPEGELGEGTTVIHRITGGSAKKGYIMRGDNRDTDDLWRPRPDDVRGRLRFHAPAAGPILLRLRSPLGLAVVAAFLTLVFLLPGRSQEPRGA